VGSACQWQCRAAPSPDWLPWAAVRTHARGLKCRPDRATSAVPTAPLARSAAPARPLPRVRHRRPDQPCPHAPVRRCHTPLSEPSHRRCRRLRRREFLHGECRLTASPRRSSPMELELTLLSLLAVAGPPQATVAPPRRGDAAAEPDFFSSPSTQSSGELACHPSCPAGSLTVVGARPPPLASSPPLWCRRRPRRDTRTGAGTAPACAALSRAASGMGQAPLCIWAERGFGPETLKLIFLFSDLFNSLQIQKFV
jgi:hypothetical protein